MIRLALIRPIDQAEEKNVRFAQGRNALLAPNCQKEDISILCWRGQGIESSRGWFFTRETSMPSTCDFAAFPTGQFDLFPSVRVLRAESYGDEPCATGCADAQRCWLLQPAK
jgi:hypothetical protein